MVGLKSCFQVRRQILTLAAFLLFAGMTPGLAQRGGPVEPGPTVAGHWAGKMVLVLSASKREVPVPLDFKLTQDGTTVGGSLTYTNPNDASVHTIDVKGIEEGGKLNLTFDFSDREHCRFHLTIVGDTLNGELFNYHDNPRSWGADETGAVTLNKSA